MLHYRRIAILVVTLLFLWVQGLALIHRVEHRSVGVQSVAELGAIAASGDRWGHDTGEPVCSLYDALGAADAMACHTPPLFNSLVFPSLFLAFISAHVALRALRANARAPPRSI
jgi:hypothetical protein